MEARRIQRQFRRLAESARASISFTIDGESVSALEGDTVLTAILLHRRALRSFEFGPERRAGFCLMGACQDCWVRCHDGGAVRACTTLVSSGMSIVTGEAGDEA